MTSARQLIPNSQQRRTHAFLDCNSQYLKPTASVGITTVREAQEVCVSSLPKPCFLRLVAAKRPNSISRVFEALNGKPNLASRSATASETAGPAMRPYPQYAVDRVANGRATGATALPTDPARSKDRYSPATVISLHLGSPLECSHLRAILHNTRLKPFADKPEHAPVCNQVSQEHQHPFIVDLISERGDSTAPLAIAAFKPRDLVIDTA